MNETKKKESGQYLTFRLGDEMFSLNIVQVREILDLSRITKIPGTPDFMIGVINVRGRVVPVIDLHIQFGMPGTENTPETRIIIMEVLLNGETTVLGALADSVHEVTELDSEQIEKPPKIGDRWRTEFVKGLGRQKDQFIIILDIDQVFSEEELELAESVSCEEIGDKEARGWRS
ncbi:MAG: chemotaxis protein CheW [Desulfobacteraceae bacterium]|nr:chemotaxis protein CheW [Desulfobacteraceae bacterium]